MKQRKKGKLYSPNKKQGRNEASSQAPSSWGHILHQVGQQWTTVNCCSTRKRPWGVTLRPAQIWYGGHPINLNPYPPPHWVNIMIRILHVNVIYHIVSSCYINPFNVTKFCLFPNITNWVLEAMWDFWWHEWIDYIWVTMCMSKTPIMLSHLNEIKAK